MITMSDALRAIRAKCLECSGGCRREVERCRVCDCPLWPLRAPEAAPRPAAKPGRETEGEQMRMSC